jgi:Ca2+:H+ antiporter|eukprot:g7657.t1
MSASSRQSFSSLTNEDDDEENGLSVQLTDLKGNSQQNRPVTNDDELMLSPGKAKRFPSVLRDGWCSYLQVVAREILLGHWMNILMLLTPLAFISKWSNWSEGVTFVASLLALCPFAERISFVTEDLAKYTNDTLGGLLNATFGNVTEVIVCIFALKRGLVRVVQVSMLGSILSNLLLVLGCAFLVGGAKYPEQKFNATAAITNSGMLLLSLFALSLPTILSSTHTGAGSFSSSVIVAANNTAGIVTTEGGDAPIGLSRFVSFLMLFMYCCYLFFQMFTHQEMFEGQEDDDEEPPVLGFWGGITLLGVLTLFISTLSDLIVDAIDGAASDLKIPYLFIGTILIPIVGNAAEHAAAIIFAYRNKMEIAMGIAVGSAVQISLFVIPFCVVLGWMMDVPMDLDFHPMETVTVILTVITVAIMIQDGKSTWLKGVLLIVIYICIGAAFWAHSDPRSEKERGL